MSGDRPARVVVLSAGLSTPSSTRLLADRLAAAVVRAADAVQIEVVELRPLAHALADRLLTGFATGELEAALDAVVRADAVVAVTPTFRASFSGLFKTFVDVLEPDALEGTPVLIAATGGTARHSLVLDHALRPLFSYLHAVVVPTGVFAATDDFGDAGLDARIDRAARELVALLGTADARGRERDDAAVHPDDDLADPVPFAELLRRASS